MTWESHQLLAVANLAICLVIAWACICRLNSDVCKYLLRPRARYTMLLAGSLASGLQPVLFGAWPGIGTVLFSASVLGGLLINVVRWTYDHNDAGNI